MFQRCVETTLDYYFSLRVRFFCLYGTKEKDFAHGIQGRGLGSPLEDRLPGRNGGPMVNGFAPKDPGCGYPLPNGPING